MEHPKARLSRMYRTAIQDHLELAHSRGTEVFKSPTGLKFFWMDGQRVNLPPHLQSYYNYLDYLKYGDYWGEPD